MSKTQQSVRRCPTHALTGVRIVGTGSFLPDNVVTNEDLARLGCDAEWIIQRTGIRERRHAPPEMATSDMAIAAAERARGAPRGGKGAEHQRRRGPVTPGKPLAQAAGGGAGQRGP
ncbi:MAG: hypothetical protein AAF790_01180, partial [Planctomycetota bacterium]